MGSSFVLFPGSQSIAIVTDDGCRLVQNDSPAADVAGGDAAGSNAAGSDAAGSDAPAKAALLTRMLKEHGYRGEAVMLALPSSLCLCASVDEKGLPHRSRQSGLQFRLEERLPLALEEFVADFIPGQDKSLGVAVALDAVEPLILGLEDQGIVIASVCPTALLITDEVLKQTQADVVMCDLNGNVDCMDVADGQVRGWSVLPKNREALELHLRALHKNHDGALKVVWVGIEAEVFQELDIAGVEHTSVGNPLALAASAAKRCLLGASPPVQLRHGKLAVRDPLRQVRMPLRAAIAAAMLLAVCGSIAMLITAGKYNHLAQEAQGRQEQAFHQALPHQKMPASITSRLISEEKRLRGLSGTATILPTAMSVLPLVHSTLAGLPANMRFRLLELRFEPHRLYLEGQTLDHSGADLIADALRHSTGLVVDPPHTEQPTGEDVTFTISAALPAPVAVGKGQP